MQTGDATFSQLFLRGDAVLTQGGVNKYMGAEDFQFSSEQKQNF